MAIDIVDQILRAIAIIEVQIPQAILVGQLNKFENALDPITLVQSTVISKTQQVNCIIDTSVTAYMISKDSNNETRSVIVMGLDTDNIGLYDELVLGSETFVTSSLKEIMIGSNIPVRIFSISV